MATSKETYYAWTDIVTAGKDESSREVIKAGTKVSKSDFSEDDWDQLVEARSVRTSQYPDMPAGYAGSPRDFRVEQINAQLEDAEDLLDDDLVNESQAQDTGMTGEPPADSGKDG
jgi:hypothetical protein